MTTEPIDIAKWIEDEKLPRTTGDFKIFGCTIGHCIPPNFESYCKIYHPFEVTPDEPDILEKKDYGQKVILNFSISPDAGVKLTETKYDGSETDIYARQHERLKDYNSKTWNLVTWKSIAEKYDLVFHNEINPQTFVNKFNKIGWQKNLLFPSEGYLPRQLLVKLLNLLKNVSTSDYVYIYQMMPHNIWKDNKDCGLVKCSFDEVLEYFDTDFKGYLYSADKSWVIFTDTDLHFTIAGGQKQLIDILLSSDLEVLECKATTRVDNYSNKINKEKAAHNSTLPKAGRKWWQKLFGSE